jgi:hypothetical protein
MSKDIIGVTFGTKNLTPTEIQELLNDMSRLIAIHVDTLATIDDHLRVAHREIGSMVNYITKKYATQEDTDAKNP